MPRVPAIGVLLAGLAVSACATTGPGQGITHAPWGGAAGFTIVQAQSPDGFMGCSAARTQLVRGQPESMAVGLYRVPSGVSLVALSGVLPGISLGDRRQVPVLVSVSGAGATSDAAAGGASGGEAGLGSLQGPRFFALTSASTLPGLAQGGTAVMRFENGPTMRQSYNPAVVDGVVRCYGEMMTAAGLSEQRVPVARPLPQFKDGTPDVMRVRIG